MTMPSVYCFELSSNNTFRIVVCVSMSEKEAVDLVKSHYTTYNICLINIISIQESGKISEICVINR